MRTRILEIKIAPRMYLNLSGVTDERALIIPKLGIISARSSVKPPPNPEILYSMCNKTWLQ